MVATLPQPELTSPTAEQWRVARLCLGVLGVLWAASALGTAFSLYLVNHYPLVLVGLSPLGRHITLAAPVAAPVALVGVTLVRRMLFYFSTYQLGRALGASAIPWIEARASYLGRFVRWMERLFAIAPRTVVLLMSGPTVSALAGVSGMAPATFLALAIPGLAVRLVALVAFAEWMREPLEWLLALIDAYWIPGTVVLASAVAFVQWRNLRAARRMRRSEG